MDYAFKYVAVAVAVAGMQRPLRLRTLCSLTKEDVYADVRTHPPLMMLPPRPPLLPRIFLKKGTLFRTEVSKTTTPPPTCR